METIDIPNINSEPLTDPIQVTISKELLIMLLRFANNHVKKELRTSNLALDNDFNHLSKLDIDSIKEDILYFEKLNDFIYNILFKIP